MLTNATKVSTLSHTENRMYFVERIFLADNFEIV